VAPSTCEARALIGAGLTAAQEAPARDVAAAMQHVVAQAQQLRDPLVRHTGRLRLVE
jgi:hypothetical protein